MKTKPEFISISILCNDGSKEQFLNKTEFNKWLYSHPKALSLVSSFPYLKYKVNDEDSHLKINKVLDKWNVVNFDEEDKVKIEFSFECNTAKEFITKLDKEYDNYLYPLF